VARRSNEKKSFSCNERVVIGRHTAGGGARLLESASLTVRPMLEFSNATGISLSLQESIELAGCWDCFPEDSRKDTFDKDRDASLDAPPSFRDRRIRVTAFHIIYLHRAFHLIPFCRLATLHPIYLFLLNPTDHCMESIQSTIESTVEALKSSLPTMAPSNDAQYSFANHVQDQFT
jgi:hypothetical protein